MVVDTSKSWYSHHAWTSLWYLWSHCKKNKRRLPFSTEKSSRDQTKGSSFRPYSRRKSQIRLKSFFNVFGHKILQYRSNTPNYWILIIIDLIFHCPFINSVKVTSKKINKRCKSQMFFASIDFTSWGKSAFLSPFTCKIFYNSWIPAPSMSI